MKKMFLLILDRISELGQQAYSLYEESTRWRAEKETPIQINERHVAFKQDLESQRAWIDSLKDLVEEIEELS